MLSPVCRATLRRAVDITQSIPVPDFLLPAFAHSRSRRCFSGSPQCRSRIGSAPVSVPPEVNLRLLEPPPRRKTVSRIETPQVIEVEGPLGWPDHLLQLAQTDSAAGKIQLPIPIYMSLKHDTEAKKATLHIPDRTERKHREMWGGLLPAFRGYQS